MGSVDASTPTLLSKRRRDAGRRVGDEERTEVQLSARLRRTNGQGLVEFALILPILLIMVLGIVEAGYAMLHQHVVSKLTREGSNLISRDITLQDAGTAMKTMKTPPVDFDNGSRLIFSVLKKVATTGVVNTDKVILYQRYEFG